MQPFPEDIFTEPDPDPVALRNLGPLAALAGTWEGEGVDIHPVAEGSEERPYFERITLQPIDPQTNGPQLFYGLRYHAFIVKPGETATFHDQIGYWLWAPEGGMLLQSLTIPRGQTALAMGQAAADARAFEVVARRGSEANGICSNPFLEHAFRTTEYRIAVAVNADGTWRYESDTVLQVRGRPEPFHHIDRNTLRRVAGPKPNPMAATSA